MLSISDILRRLLPANLVTRPSQGLKVNQTTATQLLRVQRGPTTVQVTELANAGRKGMKCRRFTLTASHLKPDDAQNALHEAVEAILPGTYGEALRWAQDAGDPKLALRESVLLGLDVDQPGTAVRLSHLAPNGDRTLTAANPDRFLVTHRMVIHAPGKEAHGQFQDTHFYSATKEDADRFYLWLKTHLQAADGMGIEDFRSLWHRLGVRWNSN